MGLMPTIRDREMNTGPDNWEGGGRTPSARQILAENRRSDYRFAKQMRQAAWDTEMVKRSKPRYRMQDGMSKNELIRGLGRIHSLKAEERQRLKDEGDDRKYWTPGRPGDLSKSGEVDRWGFEY